MGLPSVATTRPSGVYANGTKSILSCSRSFVTSGPRRRKTLGAEDSQAGNYPQLGVEIKKASRGGDALVKLEKTSVRNAWRSSPYSSSTSLEGRLPHRWPKLGTPGR